MRVLQIIKELVFLIKNTKPWRKKSFVSKSNAVLIHKCLERLGSVFIKLGQMLALRPDFIPPVFCDELYKLLDQVPSFGIEKVEIILKEELGENYNELVNLDPIPVASASFAQVHKASIGNGEVIAVKIQRPNIERVVKNDIRIMKVLAKFFDVWFKPANKLFDIVIEFEVWTQDELDYTLEANNIQKFNKISKLVGDGIRAPKVYRYLSSSRVLSMEFIDGHSLNQIISMMKSDKTENVKRLGFDGKLAITQLIKNILEMAHVHGYFHADPHPANIIFTPEKELVFIDFGIIGNLSRKERILVMRFFRTLLSGNAKDSFDSIIEFCGNKQPDNIDQIRAEYGKLVDKFVATFDTKTYLEQQIKSGPILANTLSLMQSNGMEVPVSIVRYFKAFETIEGLVFALYPELQIKDMHREFRRVTVINLVDMLPTKIDERNINNLLLKIIDSVERSFLLNN